MTTNLARRRFLGTSAAAAGSLVVEERYTNLV
jgi:hypothetical protein